MPFRQIFRRGLIGCAAIAAIAAVTLGIGWHQAPAEARLVAFEPMANFGANETCEWETATPQFPSYAAAAAGAAVQQPSADARLEVAKRPPLTFIQDPYPNFSSIAVDPVRNEIVMTDENRFRIMVYDRTAVTPASAEADHPEARHQRAEHAYAVCERRLYRPADRRDLRHQQRHGAQHDDLRPQGQRRRAARSRVRRRRTATSAPRSTNRARRCT